MKSYGPNVRVIRDPDRFSVLHVQARMTVAVTVGNSIYDVDSGWKTVREYDEMSYGYATTSADLHARTPEARFAMRSATPATQEGNPSVCKSLGAPDDSNPGGARATPDNNQGGANVR